MNITQILRPARRGHGGVQLDHRKNTSEAPSAVMPPPKQVILPMSQHIGAPCKPIVKKGDAIKVGQLIADVDSPVSAPIHASVSGTVSGIGELTMPSGQKVQTVIIDSDGKMEPYDFIAPPSSETNSQFIEAVRASGLVGLGGAGFPASVKLKPAPGSIIDTLIINCAECEPYITSDYRECIESPDDIMYGVYRLQKLLGVGRVIICVEDNKPAALDVLQKVAAKDDRIGDTVKLMKLKSRYPQGAEKVLIYAATGRVVPAGRLPADVGCIVMNITSLSFLAKYLKTGMPLVTKRITVDGSAIKNPQTVIVPIGTPIRDVIEFCGGYKCEPKKLLMGGPMMGLALCGDDMPVLKQNNAILAFDTKDAELPPVTECIGCGKCVDACPMNLMPVMVARAMKSGDTERMKKLSVMSCMECGCCAYSCPANRPIVQMMRLAKGKVRSAGR